MTELRKCPFCGGESGIDVFLYENDDNGSHVLCEKCGASIGLAFFPLTKEEAIEAWNKRVGEVAE